MELTREYLSPRKKRLSRGIRADEKNACAETYPHPLYAQIESHAQPLKDFFTGMRLGRMKEGAPQSTIWFDSGRKAKILEKFLDDEQDALQQQ